MWLLYVLIAILILSNALLWYNLIRLTASHNHLTLGFELMRRLLLMYTEKDKENK